MKASEVIANLQRRFPNEPEHPMSLYQPLSELPLNNFQYH